VHATLGSEGLEALREALGYLGTVEPAVGINGNGAPKQ
jgi:hypothetical protein